MTVKEKNRILGIARGAYKSLACLPESNERDDVALAFADIAALARETDHARDTVRLFESAGN